MKALTLKFYFSKFGCVILCKPVGVSEATIGRVGGSDIYRKYCSVCKVGISLTITAELALAVVVVVGGIAFPRKRLQSFTVPVSQCFVL